MLRNEIKAVNKAGKKGESFVLVGEKKKSYKEFTRVVHFKVFGKLKNMVWGKDKKVFPISTGLIVLTSI